MNFSFKVATYNDIPVIAMLADKIWRVHYISIISLEQIEYMLKKMYSPDSLKRQMIEGHVFSIVFNDTNPIGYLSISSKDNKEYFLHKFYVDISEQNKGVGSSLFNHVLSTIPNANTIELTVNRNNYKAINFYFKQGFKIKEVADFDIGNGYFMNDFVMVKKVK